MKHHISYFYNALLEYDALHQAWCETKFIKYRENKLTVTRYVPIKCPPLARMQAYWPLINCVINQRLLQASPHMQQTLSQLINVTNVTMTSSLHHI